MSAWTLRIETLGDWHVGSGFGVAGGIDRLATVDRDGLPLIPGKTVTGMFRDAAEQLSIGMDNGEPHGPWHVWLRWLFGDQPSRGAREGRGESLMQLGESPQPARLQVRAAELPGALRAALCRQDEAGRLLRQSLFFVKPGVKIDAASGQAEAKHLRFVQMARGGLTLHAPLLVDAELSPEQRDFVEQFLTAAAILVTHIGGKRRRGAGRCRWTLHADGNMVDATRIVEKLHADTSLRANIPQPPPIGKSGIGQGEAKARREGVPDTGASPAADSAHRVSERDVLSVGIDGEAWVDIPLVIETIDPICVAEVVVGNVTQTMDWIPGTYLLRHLSERLDPLGVSVPEAIRGDAIRVLPATVDLDGRRSMAVPLAWEMKKENGNWRDRNTLVNRLVQTPSMVTKQVRHGYISCSIHDKGEVSDYAQPPIDFFTHNTIDEEAQRPTEHVGGVYSYQALLPNRFRSLLRLRKSLAETLQQTQDWRDRLGGQLRLGRSSKDGYGRARLHVDQPFSIAESPSSHDARSCIVRDDGSATLTVMLLTDALLEDFRGRFAVTAENLVEELSAHVGVPLRLDTFPGDQEPTAESKPAAFLRVRRIESWQSSWNLPRPSLIALRAGCCLRLRVDGTPPDLADQLHRIELSGIGSRRAEGFGQVVFNHPLLDGPIRTRIPSEEATAANPVPRVPSTASPDFENALPQAEAIERTCWQRLIVQTAGDEADRMLNELGWKPNRPASTQAGALRARVSLLRRWEDREQLLHWLNHLADNRLRAKKWPGNGEKTFDNLSQQLDLRSTADGPQDARIWTWLKRDCWPRLTSGDNLDRFTSDGANWAFAVRAVLDSCVRMQQRRNRKQPTTNR